MSSEDERLLNSTEREMHKRHKLGYSDSRKNRVVDRVEDAHEIPHGSNRYFSPPQQILQRQAMNPQLGRNGMAHSASPIERMVMKDRAMIPDRPGQPEDSDLTDAMIFLNRIKEEYSDNLHVYDNFLETMRDFKFEKIDADEVCKAIRILFKDKPYLVRLFDEYLPHHLRFCDTSRNFDMQQERAKFNQFRAPNFINKPPAPMHMGQMPPNTPMHMGRLGHNIPHPPFMPRPMRQSPPPMISMQPAVEPATRARQESQAAEPESPKHRMANEFIQMVKKRYLSKPLVYKQFVELLQNSKNSFEKLFTQVSALLSDTPDLVENFERNFKAAQAPNEPAFTSDADPLKKIKHMLAKKDILDQFLKIVNFYNQNYISATDLIQMVEPIVQDKENMLALKSFIKCEEGSSESEFSKYKNLEAIGSYRILKNKPAFSVHASPYKDVLNNICICIPTHDSEEDAYIFRNKNHSEELVSRIIDERSEADLMMDRLKFLIVRLEELYEHLGDDGLEMEDIQMSSALVKETLKSIYDSKSSEIIEAILTTPKKAIPVVLTRLYKVYRENSSKLRDFRKFWRSIVEDHYYKAYDTKGVSFRSHEKNYLSLRHIQSESDIPFSVQIEDLQILDTIRELFIIFVQNHGPKDSRKLPLADQIASFDLIVENLKAASMNVVIDFKAYALYYYVILLYSRFEHIKRMKLQKLESNPIAVSVNLQQEFVIEDPYVFIVDSAKSLMDKTIDADKFEDYVRIATDSQGFRLYNLKKIMSKIEKQINTLINGDSDNSKEEDEINGGSYSLTKENGCVTICSINEARDEDSFIIN